MRRISPTPHLPDSAPTPSRARRRLARFLTVLLAFMAIAVWGQVVFRAATRQKARVAQRAAEEKAARATWTALAQNIPASDRPNLQAFARVPAGTLPPQFRSGTKAQIPEQILAGSRTTLIDLHRALYLPYRPEPEQATNSMMGVYRGTNFRPLAQLLLVEGAVQQSRGDRASAASTFADLIQMGQTVRRGGPLNALTLSSANDQMGRSALWKLLPSLDAQTARKLARRLEEQGATDDDWYVNALREERTFGNIALADAFGNPKKLQQIQKNARLSALISAMMQSQGGLRVAFNARQFTNATNAASASAPLPTLYNRGMQKWEECKARQSFDWTMGAYGLDARQPFQLWRLRTVQAQAAAMAAQSGRGRVAPLGFPASQLPQQAPYAAYTSYGSPGMVEFAQSQFTETQTGNRLLRVACALAAYRSEHKGRDPNALSDLVPAYLSRIPDDPYAFPVAPLAYISPAQNALSTNTRGTLYSVGPDGVDDGGVAPQGSIRRFGMGYYYGGAFSQSVGSGDLIAGKNAP